MNAKQKFAKFRTHFFRVSPIMNYGLTFINYVMLVFLSIKAGGAQWWIYTIPVVMLVFFFMWKLDDGKDVIGDEYIYNFFRSKPQSDILVLLKRMDKSKRPITVEERNEIRDEYLKK